MTDYQIRENCDACANPRANYSLQCIDCHRAAIKSELHEIVTTCEKDSRITGRIIDRLVTSLTFHNASPSEFRGLSDTGLTDAELAALCEFKIPGRLLDSICNQLYED